MARPRKQTYTMQQYLDNVREGYISNDADTQRNPAWKPIVDGLAVTILTDDYIPAIILAEEESGQGHIVDGGSRTASFMMLKYGNYKIKSSVEDPIIPYKKMCKDENGIVTWEDSEFDIRNKTYDQFPKELQKRFNEYQIDTVVHECDLNGIAKYLKRYNSHTSMTTNQKMFVYIPRFAKKIRQIVNMRFFADNSAFKDSEKEKGMLERTILETVMCMFHLDKWNKTWKKNPDYLNNNATDEEFKKVEENISHLEKIITDETRSLFDSKDTFIWLTLFGKFAKTGLDDSEFADFLREFVSGLKDKKVDGKLFYTVDKEGSTKDKSVIVSKLHILETLMNEYLHIENESRSSDEFISEVVDIPIESVREDLECYEQTLEELKEQFIKYGSKLLDDENEPSLLAMVAYSYKNDIDLDDWIADYAKRNNTYILNQKRNYEIMLKDLENYLQVNHGFSEKKSA